MKSSKEAMNKVNRKNQLLEMDLKRRTVALDKHKALLEREKSTIAATRRNIAEDIDTYRRSVDMPRLTIATLKSEDEKNSWNKASSALQESKGMLNAVIEKAKSLSSAYVAPKMTKA